MQYKAVSVLALAATAFAAHGVKRQASSLDPASVLSVLETALPSSLVQEALTNSDAVSSEIASDFSIGSTPTWFAALPSDIQTYLLPSGGGGSGISSVVANATSNGTAPASSTPTPSSDPSAAAAAAAAASQSSMQSSMDAQDSSMSGTASMTSMPDPSASGPSGAVAVASPTSSTSMTGGASLPTAAYGIGLAGAVGLVGLIAL